MKPKMIREKQVKMSTVVYLTSSGVFDGVYLWLFFFQLDQKGPELKLVDGYGQMVKTSSNNQIRSRLLPQHLLMYNSIVFYN